MIFELPISVLSLEANVFTKKKINHIFGILYLATIHELYGRLPEEKINMVLILQGTDKMRLI